jgi:hypothetical protein
MQPATQPVATAEDFRRFAEDKRLSLNGRAVLTFLASKPPGYGPNVPDVIALTQHARRKSGKCIVYQAFTELRELGYVSARRTNLGVDYTLHLNPINGANGAGA